MIALEEAGLAYEARLVSFMRGEHRAEPFLAINPGGKVPVLLVDGAPLTENVAIIAWIAATCPEAGLLPPAPDALGASRHLSDLAWCASGLHPLVTRMRLPQMFCALPDARDDVRGLAQAAMRRQLAIVERRLTDTPWWYGQRWSILDAYIGWVWFRVTGCGIDPAEFPRVQDHTSRMADRPSVQRVLARHAEASRALREAGLAVDFDAFGLPSSGKAA